ncbi:tail fiber assembly protein [Pseudomonas sp. lyk4-R2A-10]|uniref:tail fiber assembly protein n=1 Tax=Pseudomonas sp. lyk4-R2A-10 TaxID=3040315 RepID=UPI0025530C5A|nr:tail fiber assembly protein [Pseudomonas sp. lyk4-R2A-10]
MFASKSTRGFYDAAIHLSMPDDVVEISPEEHADLMAQQSEGKVIEWASDGYPYAADPPPPSTEELIGIERAWRDTQLTATDGVVTRHRDELEEGTPTTLSAEQYAALQEYRRALRAWPQGEQFPLIEHRPAAPAWLADHTQ